MSIYSQKKVIFILGKDSVINEVIIDDLPASINCEAFEKAEILCFDRMKFLDIYKQLQEKNPDVIVLVRNGIFFVAFEKSALALQALFTLRPICFREGVCKCVIPVQQIKKYMDRMIYLKYKNNFY